jgi:hypothetical protein
VVSLNNNYNCQWVFWEKAWEDMATDAKGNLYVQVRRDEYHIHDQIDYASDEDWSSPHVPTCPDDGECETEEIKQMRQREREREWERVDAEQQRLIGHTDEDIDQLFSNASLGRGATEGGAEGVTSMYDPHQTAEEGSAWGID